MLEYIESSILHIWNAISAKIKTAKQKQNVFDFAVYRS